MICSRLGIFSELAALSVPRSHIPHRRCRVPRPTEMGDLQTLPTLAANWVPAIDAVIDTRFHNVLFERPLTPRVNTKFKASNRECKKKILEKK